MQVLPFSKIMILFKLRKAAWLKLHLKSESLNAIIAIAKILSQIIQSHNLTKYLWQSKTLTCIEKPFNFFFFFLIIPCTPNTFYFLQSNMLWGCLVGLVFFGGGKVFVCVFWCLGGFFKYFLIKCKIKL